MSALPAPDPQRYLDFALPLIPRVLQLLDRDPSSPTHGCFDRQYWHFRTMDFPAGMSQEFVLPLALVHELDLPDSPWKGQARLRDWARAAVTFARRSAHPDASCDDYYPYERALGAVVFSLYAMAETCRLLRLHDGEDLAFLRQRARWVAKTGESGVLTNHHAIAALALQVTGELCEDADLQEAAKEKAREVLGHQHEEGWYREYDGFDPGYQTVTVDFLARYWKESGDEEVLPSLEKACALLERVQHPDGSFGGEYASRNTYHVQPHGFELLAPRIPAAGRIADRFLGALALGRRAHNDDDRLLGHALYPYLMAWRDRAPREDAPPPPPVERSYLSGCGFLVERTERDFLIAGLKKGGPYRYYAGHELRANDSGPLLRTVDGQILVPHRAHSATPREEADGSIVTEGPLHAAGRELVTPTKSIVLRLVMLTLGRFARTLVRKLLQRRLITGGKPSPFRHRRTFRREGEALLVEDHLEAETGAPAIEEAWLAVGQTSIYIAASHPWEPGWLLPWTPLEDAPAGLSASSRYTYTRRLTP